MRQKTILIAVDDSEIRSATLEDNIVTELAIERQEERGILGNIYKGIVKDIVPGMDAAFVDIGWQRTGFLYVSEVMVLPDINGEISLWEKGSSNPLLNKDRSMF